MNQHKSNLIGSIVEVPSLVDPLCPDDIGFLVIAFREGRFLVVKSASGNIFEIRTNQITKIYYKDPKTGEYSGL